MNGISVKEMLEVSTNANSDVGLTRDETLSDDELCDRSHMACRARRTNITLAIVTIMLLARS